MIKCLFKFAKNPYENAIEIDTTSNSGKYSDLSPFKLGPCETYVPAFYSRNFENLWQYSKVYKECLNGDGKIDWERWTAWRNFGWMNSKAIRYPMGKGVKPLFSYWKFLEVINGNC